MCLSLGCLRHLINITLNFMKNDEFVRIANEQQIMVLAYSKYFSVICREELRKHTNKNFRTDGVAVRIRRENIPNANLERYRYINLLGYIKLKFASQLSANTGCSDRRQIGHRLTRVVKTLL
jgi:hypothetical protein